MINRDSGMAHTRIVSLAYTADIGAVHAEYDIEEMVKWVTLRTASRGKYLGQEITLAQHITFFCFDFPCAVYLAITLGNPRGSRASGVMGVHAQRESDEAYGDTYLPNKYLHARRGIVSLPVG